jgi:hypothetical protein
MLIHCVAEGIELSPDQAAEVEASTSAWIEQTIPDGVSLHGAYLEPVSEARTVRLYASDVLVADGPVAETKEQIGGYDVIGCADLDEATGIAPGTQSPGSARSKCGRFNSSPLWRRWSPASRTRAGAAVVSAVTGMPREAPLNRAVPVLGHGAVALAAADRPGVTAAPVRDPEDDRLSGS